MEDLRVKKGEELLQKYREGKQSLDRRIVSNEEWYKMRHWEEMRANEAKALPGGGTPTLGASAWLFNSLANKHADAMDNYPQPNFLPREEGDKADAEALSQIVPVILEQNNFEAAYNTAWWDKLKTGTAVYKIFWDTTKENGLGDIGIEAVDILNLFWEPGVRHIQKSPHLFHVELVNREELEARYPDMTFSGGDTGAVTKYIHNDYIDTADKCLVVDWYYKKQEGSRTILHFIKFCEGNLLYATEDTAGMENGLYDHGEYPYVFDVLFPEKDSPVGFGYVDIMKDAQISIDNMWNSMEKNVKWCAEPRYFSKQGMGINKEQFADLRESIVEYAGSHEDIDVIQTRPVSGIATGLYQMKIDELKETSSNRDFSQGSVANGVTAASAIAALQEAGSKTSRDMLKAAYRAFRDVNRLVVELIRQFYDMPREFRITGKMGDEFRQYDNSGIKPQTDTVMGVEIGGRKPIFDIKITSQKASPFSRMAQNELAKELYGAGIFNPELSDQALACLEMMDFEGIAAVKRKVAENGTMMQQIQQMQGQIMQMAGIIDQLTGRDLTGAIGIANTGGGMPPNIPAGKGKQTDALGDAFQSAKGNTIADRAAERARKRTEVQ